MSVRGLLHQLNLATLDAFVDEIVETGYWTKQHLHILDIGSSQCVAKQIHLSTQKDIDGHSAVAFVPPDITKFQKQPLFVCVRYGSIVIEGVHTVIAVLHNAHILAATVAQTGEKRILFLYVVDVHGQQLFT